MIEYNLNTNPVTFLSIKELSVTRQINEHAVACISGYIADDDEETYLNMMTGEVWEKIEEIGKDGDEQTLFWGLITSFSIEQINDQKKMTLEITSGTFQMDLQRHLRTFQDVSATYDQIFKDITGHYDQSSLIINKPLKDPIGGLVLQYHETDWEFLKRLAGRYQSFLVPSTAIKGIKYFVDLPKGDTGELPSEKKYTVKKNLDEFRTKKKRGLPSAREADYLEYWVESREDHNIGDKIVINGQSLTVKKILSRYIGGEMIHTCILSTRAGMDTLETFQEEMSGCSLTAAVIQVKNDKVQLKVKDDENGSQTANVWYPYATVYSTVDGTGWYCMPEIGDEVRLYLPDRAEAAAYAASSVHLDTESSDRKNPNHKILKNKYQKEIRFTPDSIVITNNQGTKIELTDAEGVHIVSSHSVLIESAEDLTLSSETGSLLAAGTTLVNLKQKGTSINLDTGVSFTGGELKVQ